MEIKNFKIKEQSAHGFNWKSKINKKKNKQSHTPGNSKVLTCRATKLKRYLSKHSRSYKHPDFKNWYPIFNKR